MDEVLLIQECLKGKRKAQGELYRIKLSIFLSTLEINTRKTGERCILQQDFFLFLCNVLFLPCILLTKKEIT